MRPKRQAVRLDGRRRSWCVVAIGVAVLVSIAGCGNSNQNSNDPFAHTPGQVHFYGSDGNMLNSIGDMVTKTHPNGMVGMRGTTPLTPLSQSFKDRLLGVDPGLKDFSYAGESYDAVILAALAAQAGSSTDSKTIAQNINGVTVGSTPCDTPASCLSLIRQGKGIHYRGITLGLGGFTSAGEPSASTYGVLRFSNGNHMEDYQTEFVPTGNAGDAVKPSAFVSGETSGNAPLRIGALLPHTGDLAGAGPPMFAGTRLAVKELNDAGGILGQPVKYVDGDDGTNATKALATVQRLVNDEHVQVIIGAGASGVTLKVLPAIVAAGVVLFSPANTSAELTTADDHGLYFRTAPPDGLQAAALSDVIMRDGSRKLAVIYRDDSYGAGLAKSTKEDLIKSGLSEGSIHLLSYNPDSPDFASVAAQAKAFDPDGVLIVAFDETATIFDELFKDGFSSLAS